MSTSAAKLNSSPLILPSSQSSRLTSLHASMATRLAKSRAVNLNPRLEALEIELCRRSVEYLFDSWAWTYDPRNAGTELPTRLPFDMWAKQREFLRWLDARSEANEDGLAEKSRDAGFTWLMVGWSWHKWRFVPGFDIAFGSRVMELVDRLGDPDSIFEKLRMFYRNLPRWLLPEGFDSS